MTTLNTAKLIAGTKLNSLIKESKSADAIFHALATRQRIRGFTDLNRIRLDLARGNFEVNEKDTKRLFSELEKLGYGYTVAPKSEGGNPRFIWKFDMRKVATAAIQGVDTVGEELNKEMQRYSDSPRKKSNKKITRKRLPKILKKTETVQEAYMAPVPPMQPLAFNMNGHDYIAIEPAEYDTLRQIKELLAQIK